MLFRFNKIFTVGIKICTCQAKLFPLTGHAPFHHSKSYTWIKAPSVLTEWKNQSHGIALHHLITGLSPPIPSQLFKCRNMHIAGIRDPNWAQSKPGWFSLGITSKWTHGAEPMDVEGWHNRDLFELASMWNTMVRKGWLKYANLKLTSTLWKPNSEHSYWDRSTEYFRVKESFTISMA